MAFVSTGPGEEVKGTMRSGWMYDPSCFHICKKSLPSKKKDGITQKRENKQMQREMYAVTRS